MSTSYDFLTPPPRKVVCPIIDAHTHVNVASETINLVYAARLYNITRIIGIASLDHATQIEKAFPQLFSLAVMLDYAPKDDPLEFARVNLARIESAAERGYPVIKFWFKPTFNYEQNQKFDDPILAPIFDRMAELGLTGLVHIADPDIWFEKHYADTAKYGTKMQNYEQLENMLRRHPQTNIIGAHFGGDPEHLDHLAYLLDTYPNYYIDCSATKWITREVSLKPHESRDFIIRYADRILFGTDLVVRKNWPVELYASRYWVHRTLWETSNVCDMPIDDPDHPGNAQIVGIDLPVDVLEKMYYQNAVRLLKVQLEA